MKRTSHTTKFHRRRKKISGLTPPEETAAMQKAAENYVIDKKPFPGRKKRGS